MCRSLTPTIRHTVEPRWLGRAFPRWAKIPTKGQPARPPRMSSAVAYFRILDAVEQKEDFGVGELIESSQAVGSISARIQFNAG
jgi:hypothetical protein